ncbi:hypothetical protein ACT3TD_01185 [Corynebacterium sp. AOP36-E1-14]|uniref:hypothetical protein n=1 Tax=Corynebacterium sp. AOP36-E1-14 TaxID=3457682 RepID=UPI0040333850
MTIKKSLLAAATATTLAVAGTGIASAQDGTEDTETQGSLSSLSSSSSEGEDGDFEGLLGSMADASEILAVINTFGGAVAGSIDIIPDIYTAIQGFQDMVDDFEFPARPFLSDTAPAVDRLLSRTEEVKRPRPPGRGRFVCLHPRTRVRNLTARRSPGSLLRTNRSGHTLPPYDRDCARHPRHSLTLPRTSSPIPTSPGHLKLIYPPPYFALTSANISLPGENRSCYVLLCPPHH